MKCTLLFGGNAAIMALTYATLVAASTSKNFVKKIKLLKKKKEITLSVNNFIIQGKS